MVALSHAEGSDIVRRGRLPLDITAQLLLTKLNGRRLADDVVLRVRVVLLHVSVLVGARLLLDRGNFLDEFNRAVAILAARLSLIFDLAEVLAVR